MFFVACVALDVFGVVVLLLSFFVLFLLLLMFASF